MHSRRSCCSIVDKCSKRFRRLRRAVLLLERWQWAWRRPVSSAGDDFRTSLAQVDKPIDGGNHDRAADNISNCHRQQIANEKVSPGQLVKVRRRLSYTFPE